MANVVEIDVKANDRTRGFAGIREGLTTALSGMKTIAVAAGSDLAASLSGPLVAAAGATVAAFASAGAAVGAFGLAVAPQLGKITDLEADLSKLPPATAQAARAFRGLRSDFLKWSDALAKDTMPVFTKGLNAARAALPALTPLVKAAAAALGGFMGQLQKDAQSQGFRKFTTQLADASRSILPALLNSLRNVAIGFGGLISAFLPMAEDLSGGLENLTAKFADFGRGLSSNPAFQEWMAEMSSRGPEIIGLLGNLAKIIINVAEAMAPFTGVTLKVTAALAEFVAAIPQGVMDWLAPTITGIVLAIKAWTVVQGILNVLLAANPIGLVVVAVAALAAGLIYAYKNSETFRNIVNGAFEKVKETGAQVWEFIRPGFEKMSDFLGTILPEAAAFLSEAITGLADDATKVTEKITGINVELSKMPEEGEGVIQWFKDNWAGVLGGLIAGPVGASIGYLEQHLGVIKNMFRRAGVWLRDDWSNTWDRMNRALVNGGKRLASNAHEAVGNTIRRLLSPWPGAQARFSQFWDGLADRARRGATRIMNAALDLTRRIGGLRPSWSGLWSGLSSAGARVIGILSNILARAQSIVSRIRGAMGRAIPFMASGGISHAAEGGPRGNLTLVGEQGPELVRLPQGAQVWPHGTSMGMLSRMGGGGGDVRLVWAGGPGDEVGKALWDWFKENVRVEGGGGADSVQRALGA